MVSGCWKTFRQKLHSTFHAILDILRSAGTYGTLPHGLKSPRFQLSGDPRQGAGGGESHLSNNFQHMMSNGSNLDSKEVKSGPGWTRTGLYWKDF